MTNKTEALKLALEALEFIPESGSMLGSQAETKRLQAITAMREALADSALDRMAENARELGLDYEPIVEQVEDSVGMGHKAWDMVDPKELAKEFHKALAEPPCKTGSQCTNKCQQCEQPAQRTWVGLTDEEYSNLHDGLYQQGKSLGWVVDQIEAKLREKNNG